MPRPAILFDEEILPETDFQANRRKGIGSSDVSAILGLNPFKTAFDVYVEKKGLVKERKATTSMKVGRAVERAIGEEYQAQTGRLLVWQGDVQHVDPERDWRRCHPDAFLTYESGGLECKHVGARQAKRWGPSGTDLVPEEHVLQVVWCMSITNRDFWDIAGWLGPDDLRIFTVLRDLELEGNVIERCDRFWRENVLAGVPPDVRSDQADADFFKKRFPSAMGGLRQATTKEIEDAMLLRAARQIFADAKAGRELVEAELKLSIGTSEGIEGPDFRITWKNDRPKVKPDWQAVARELARTHPSSTALAEAVAQFTTTAPGTRRFLPRFEGEDEEKE
jgi:putative phage-type endonuclease